MATYPELCMIINGEKVGLEHRRTQAIVNPATEEVIGQLPLADSADLDRALATAKKGFQIWRDSTPAMRSRVLLDAARLMEERGDELAAIASMEMGKPFAEARIEVHMNAGLFEFYAGECHRIYGRSLVRPRGQRSTVVKVPVGPVAAFSPWNFPIGNPGRKLGAPIAAGCSVIMKSAEEAPASGVAVLQCLLDAGLPPEVAQAVYGVPDEVSRHLVASPIIKKLSFTGSTVVGKHLVKLCAEDMKRTTMELGGHGPVLVFEDADINHVLDVMVPHKFRNSGQVCVSSTRFLVHESLHEAFVAEFAKRAAAWRVGNGLDPNTQMGPMAHERGLQNITRLVNDAVSHGATLHTGGHRVGDRGWFFAPTVLSNVPLGSEIMNTEPFGPVALINSFSTYEEAIEEANRLPYGLAAYAWTNDNKRKQNLGIDIEAGMVGLNTVMIAGPDSPFCGLKWSGHGAESGPEGLEACLVTKSIHEI
jgi:succinate-semialdehyde dehydrogenase/glutarate-semialdehyde dehydrogenase